VLIRSRSNAILLNLGEIIAEQQGYYVMQQTARAHCPVCCSRTVHNALAWGRCEHARSFSKAQLLCYSGTEHQPRLTFQHRYASIGGGSDETLVFWVISGFRWKLPWFSLQ
jgi:hypothetical protein